MKPIFGHQERDQSLFSLFSLRAFRLSWSVFSSVIVEKVLYTHTICQHKCNTNIHVKVLSAAFNVSFEVMRTNNKAYHNDDCVQQKRNRVDQRYEHALGIKVLEIRKGPARK